MNLAHINEFHSWFFKGIWQTCIRKCLEKLLSKESTHNITEIVSKWIEFIMNAILRTFTQSNLNALHVLKYILRRMFYN